MRAARELAGGDSRRIIVQRDGSVLVANPAALELGRPPALGECQGTARANSLPQARGRLDVGRGDACRPGCRRPRAGDFGPVGLAWARGRCPPKGGRRREVVDHQAPQETLAGGGGPPGQRARRSGPGCPAAPGGGFPGDGGSVEKAWPTRSFADGGPGTSSFAGRWLTAAFQIHGCKLAADNFGPRGPRICSASSSELSKPASCWEASWME